MLCYDKVIECFWIAAKTGELLLKKEGEFKSLHKMFGPSYIDFIASQTALEENLSVVG